MTFEERDPEVLNGSRLIYLISQPRAGSTLLQRILACHPDVHTASEPWLMLHVLYALKPQGITAEYDAAVARAAMRGFVTGLPGGEETYHRAIRGMAIALYEAALSGTGKRRFLDKTPRYYFIANDLARLFPRARFVVLMRNPLAVLASMLDIWTDPESLLFWPSIRNDLARAPRLLVEAVASLGSRAVVVHYESLVRDPHVQVPALCRGLELDVTPEMVEYGRHDLPHWQLGDKETVYREERPVAAYADRWLRRIREPQRWRLASDYLELLGPDTLAGLGYDYGELRGLLDAERPGRGRLLTTFPLRWWLEGRPAQLASASLLARFQAEGMAAIGRVASSTVARGDRRVRRAIQRVTRWAGRSLGRRRESATPREAGSIASADVRVHMDSRGGARTGAGRAAEDDAVSMERGRPADEGGGPPAVSVRDRR